MITPACYRQILSLICHVRCFAWKGEVKVSINILQLGELAQCGESKSRTKARCAIPHWAIAGFVQAKAEPVLNISRPLKVWLNSSKQRQNKYSMCHDQGGFDRIRERGCRISARHVWRREVLCRIWQRKSRTSARHGVTRVPMAEYGRTEYCCRQTCHAQIRTWHSPKELLRITSNLCSPHHFRPPYWSNNEECGAKKGEFALEQFSLSTPDSFPRFSCISHHRGLHTWDFGWDFQYEIGGSGVLISRRAKLHTRWDLYEEHAVTWYGFADILLLSDLQ